MGLVGVFQRHAAPAVWDRLGKLLGLAAALGGIVRQGQQHFPQIALSIEPFLAFLARHLPMDIMDEESMAALHGHELYLLCAYGLGDPAAVDIVDSQYLPDVRTALYRLRVTDAVVAEIIQELRLALIAMQDSGDERRGYSGRGSLAGWLRVVAVRRAGKHLRREPQHLPADAAVAEILPMPAMDVALLQHTYKEQLSEAFRRAVVSLSSRQRNLLRYHFVAHLSIDQISRIYGAHRATAARWVHRAQEELAQKTRAEFQRIVPISDDGVSHLMALVQSQLSLSLADWLNKDAEPEGVT